MGRTNKYAFLNTIEKKKARKDEAKQKRDKEPLLPSFYKSQESANVSPNASAPAPSKSQEISKLLENEPVGKFKLKPGMSFNEEQLKALADLVPGKVDATSVWNALQAWSKGAGNTAAIRARMTK